MTYRQRKERRQRGRGRGGRQVALGLGVVGIIAAIALLSVAGYILAVAATAPDLSELKPHDKGENSEIFAADGSRLGYVQSDEIRTPVPWKDMPRDIRHAVVAIEDERFYEHKGVDYSAIVRAGVKNIESGKNVQGGSTITQQLVRALYIKDPKRNFTRKIREAKLASELEKKHSKKLDPQELPQRRALRHRRRPHRDRNRGRGRDVLQQARQAADAGEAALLAACRRRPRSTTRSAARARRWSAATRCSTRWPTTSSSRAPRRTRPRRSASSSSAGTRYTSRREPYFFDYVQEKLIEKYGVGVYRRGGLKVYTTIDPKLQDAARKAIQGQLPNPADPSSAIVSIDPSNGYIRAMASSGTYKDRRFNLAAQGHRQPGSSFKTMVLMTAIRKGIDPNSTTYTSKPLDLNVPGYGPWKVKTYGNTYGGSMNLVHATLDSDNTVYAQLIIDVGPKAVRETAKMMGIETKLDGLPAEGLGGLRLGVSPLEMARRLRDARLGRHPQQGEGDPEGGVPRRQDRRPGQARAQARVHRRRGLRRDQDPQAEREGRHGHTGADYGCPAAGKTGTTDAFNDAWFVGYTPKLATATWMGYPNALTPMPGVAGGTIPAEIWHDYMNVAKGDFCGPFDQPQEQVKYSPFFGKYSSTGRSRGTGGSYYSSPPTGPGDNSAGGQNYRGYDPRLYEAPPQKGATPGAPPSTPQAPGDGKHEPERNSPGGTGGNGATAGTTPKGKARAVAPAGGVAELALIESIRRVLGAPGVASCAGSATTPPWCARGRWR